MTSQGGHLAHRLDGLFGHELFVTVIDQRETSVPPGKLIEVGADYIMLQSEPVEGGPTEGADWLVPKAQISIVMHAHDCPVCLTAAANSSAKKPK